MLDVCCCIWKRIYPFVSGMLFLNNSCARIARVLLCKGCGVDIGYCLFLRLFLVFFFSFLFFSFCSFVSGCFFDLRQFRYLQDLHVLHWYGHDSA